MRAYSPGELIVYVKEKHSCHPGPRARNVQPTRGGDAYSYVVRKYWMIDSVEGQRLRLRTPGGKLHEVSHDNPHLRRPSIRERLWLRTVARARWKALQRPGTS